MAAWTDEELLEALVAQAPGYMVVVEGPELEITHANQAACDLVGQPQVVGLSARALFRGTPALVIVERVFATGQAETFTESSPLLGEQITPTYITRTYSPLKGPDGTVRGVLNIGVNVTAAVEARSARQAKEQSSRTQLAAVFALFDEAPVMLSVYEPPDWKLVMANRSVRQMFGGIAPVGTLLREMVPTENKTLTHLDRVYATGCAETYETIGETGPTTGRSFTVSVVPIRGPNEEIAHVMCATLETTEQLHARKALEAQAHDLDVAREHAIAASRAKDQFLAMLGHELRNPLQPMLTAVQVMRLDGSRSPVLDMLEREVQHLNRLVDDLLDVSRITRGLITLKLEPLALRTVVSRGLELASMVLEKSGHHVTTDLDLLDVGVSGDLQRLAQVVSNLVQNAAKFSAPGSQIRIWAERGDDRVLLRISDDGVGIAPELLPRVFEPFVQGDQSLVRSSAGLGLGLAIVKSLVEAHGGAVAVHSEGHGRGSTFAIELPAIQIPTKRRASSPQIQRLAATKTPIRILIVDDNVESAEILKIGLFALGHQVDVAFDGPSALELAVTEPPQLALLDIGLPGMTGYELGEKLYAAHSIPIIAITGYGQSTDHERSRAAGFVAHLVKPVDLGELRSLVDQLAAHLTISGRRG